MASSLGDGAVLEVLDAAALRQWCRTALALLGSERERIDSLNVFPVADADTGTNLFLTVEAACEAVEAGAADHPDDFAAAMHDLAHGAFLGARGNSGVILSQILRGMAEAVAGAPDVPGVGGKLLGVAFARAARSAYAAVSAPAEGTILTVVRDAADAVVKARSDHLGDVVQLALDAAIESLARTPDQMALLRRHGVVDAGGAGLVVLLDALVEVVTGVVPTAAARSWDATSARGQRARAAGQDRPTGSADGGELGVAATRRSSALGWPRMQPAELAGTLEAPPTAAAADRAGPSSEAVPDLAYEVMFLLEAPESALGALRSTLEPLGDSLLVVGGDGLWNVHVHANDVGAVIEAGLAAGKPYRIRVTHLTIRMPVSHVEPCADGPARVVLLIVEGEGVAALAREAGATALAVKMGAEASTPAVLGVVRATAPAEAIVIPGAERFRPVAEAAAEDARRQGVRTSVVPVRAAVQALAAIAVHDPSRRFDDDVVAMTAAAGATRYAAVTVAQDRAMTSVGICEPGDVLGLLEGDVVLLASDAALVARDLVERLLGGGGELVTLIHGEDGAALAAGVRRHLTSSRPDVDCLVYAAGATSDMLLLGVE